MYRICYIDNWQRNHQKALFHKWVDNPITKKDGTQVMQTLALVEFEDGTMYRAEYSTVRFEDTEAMFRMTEAINDAYKRPSEDDLSDIDDGVDELAKEGGERW